MKKVIQALFETFLFSGIITLMAMKFPGRLADSEKVYLFCLTVGFAIFASTGTEAFIGRKFRHIHTHHEIMQLVIDTVVSFLSVSIVFGCAYGALSRFGGIPISLNILSFTSILSASTYLLIGVITDLNTILDCSLCTDGTDEGFENSDDNNRKEKLK